MSTQTLGLGVPHSPIDLYAPQQLLDPWEGYRSLRDQAPITWLTDLEMYAITGYAEAKKALSDWQTFSSASGVMMNDAMNMVLRGNTLCSDGERHDIQRRVVLDPLTPKALKPLKPQIDALAQELVDGLVTRKSFDAVTDLAQHLPVNIVSNLVGLPEEGRSRMLVWASEMFNCFGPDNERTRASMPVLEEMMEYATNHAVPGKLKPGSWAEAVHHAAARGEIESSACPAMMIDYMGPSLDTTIFAIANAVYLFAQNPDQWDTVRAHPEFISSAINEVLRMESPIQGWTRYLEKDAEIGEVLMPAGSRALILWGAANRDPRQFENPDHFDVRRNPVGHLGFGAGPHACVGMNLAKLEIRAVLEALVERVARFEITGAADRALNHVLRGFTRLDITVH